VIFEPLDFIARLAALVPPPRLNLTRFHGNLRPTAPGAPGSRWPAGAEALAWPRREKKTARQLSNWRRNPYGSGLGEVSASFQRAHWGKNIQSWPNHTCPSQAKPSQARPSRSLSPIRRRACAELFTVLSYSEVP